MADTNFIDNSPSTPIVAAWLNDVNVLTYRVFNPGGVLTGAGASMMGTVQPQAGASIRTVQSKLSDLIATSDYTSLAAAKAAALALGYPVYDMTGVTIKDKANIVGNVYGVADAAGVATEAMRTSDPGTHVGKESYPLFIESRPLGTGDNAVVSTDYGFGVSAVKQNWMTTGVIGQVCGMNVVVRGGYQGTFVNMNGDIAGYISNVVTSSPDYAASWESVCGHQPGNAAIDQLIRTQIGVINVQNVNYIGFYANKQTGTGGDGVLIGNTVGGGNNWTNILRSVRDGATNFIIDVGGNVKQYPVGASNNSVTTGNVAGRLHWVNDGGVEMGGIDQAGNFSAGSYPISPTGYNTNVGPAAQVTIGCQTGAFGAASILSANYLRRGTLIFVDVYYTITTVGTAAGSLKIGLPYQSTTQGFIGGGGNVSGGKSMQASFANSGDVVASFALYDGTTPCTTTGTGHVSFYYEATS